MFTSCKEDTIKRCRRQKEIRWHVIHCKEGDNLIQINYYYALWSYSMFYPVVSIENWYFVPKEVLELMTLSYCYKLQLLIECSCNIYISIVSSLCNTITLLYSPLPWLLHFPSMAVKKANYYKYKKAKYSSSKTLKEE